LTTKPPRFGFTLQFNGRARVLGSDVGVSEAYDPASGGTAPTATTFKAVWDTGASGSVITDKVIQTLNLQAIDKQETHTANGKRLAQVFLVNMYLPNKVVFQGIRVTDGDIYGTDVLIGMDIIGSGDFAVTHSDGKTCMSFQIPSTQRIDFVKEIGADNLLKKPNKTKFKRSRHKMPWD